MRKFVLILAAASAFSVASVASATTTVVPGSVGSTVGTATVQVTDPNNLALLTTNVPVGDVTSYFDFTVDGPEIGKFSLTTTNGTITLLDLTAEGGPTVLSSVMGTGTFAALLTSGVLNAGNTYRFAYSANLTSAGNVGGTATFSAAAVPEPATWALMLLGFVGIGTAMRRRRSPLLAQVA